jgi:glycosyltransferase involved in cell wall biosynthesis
MIDSRGSGSIEIDVIIPTFQRFESTLKAVESALNQTYPVKKIFVIDDGSEKQIQEKLAESLRFEKVELILGQRTAHPGRVRNLGLQKSKSDWVAFLDSDDAWDQEKIELQVDVIRKHSARAICTSAKSQNDNSDFGKGNTVVLSKSLLSKRNVIINSSVLIQRTILDQVNGVSSSFSVRGCEDYATWLRVASITDWYWLQKNLCVYNDESVDSVRLDVELKENLADLHAQLDFLSWIISVSNKKKLGVFAARKICNLVSHIYMIRINK